MDAGTLSWAVLTISTTGFFFLVAWIRQITTQTIISDLKEIKLALIGDLQTPGLITKVHDNTREIKIIKDLCKEKFEILDKIAA